MGSALTRFFARIGHLWIENPMRLAAFGAEAGRALLGALAGFAPRTLGPTLRLYADELFKALLRGVVPVLLLGGALAAGLGGVAQHLNPLLLPTFDHVVMPIVLLQALPLSLAVFIAARSGASLAAKFAGIAVTELDGDWRFDRGRLVREFVPKLVAATLTSGIFYALLVLCGLQGYLTRGSWSRFPAPGVGGYLDSPGIEPAVWAGLFKSLLFGAVVLYTAAGIGANNAVAGARDEQAPARHYAVWETTVTAIVLCAALNFALQWTALGRPGA